MDYKQSSTHPPSKESIPAPIEKDQRYLPPSWALPATLTSSATTKYTSLNAGIHGGEDE